MAADPVLALQPQVFEGVICTRGNGKQILTLDAIDKTSAKTGIARPVLIHAFEQLGYVHKDGKSHLPVVWDRVLVMNTLSVAAGLTTVAAYTLALFPNAEKLGKLRALNQQMSEFMSSPDPDMRQGAYLDYEFHVEMIRLSNNPVALEAYRAVKPAAWLYTAPAYSKAEGLASITEHERLLDHIEAGDAMRARDAATFHMQDAIEMLRRSAPEDQNTPALA